MEEILTIEPPFSCINCIALRVPQKVPSTVVVKLACQSAVLISVMPPQVYEAALFTITSSLPYSLATASIASTKVCSSLTSTTLYAALPPWAEILATTAFNGSSRRPNTTTVAPSSAIRTAVAAPIPALPPVTIATLFSSLLVIVCYPLVKCHRSEEHTSELQS